MIGAVADATMIQALPISSKISCWSPFSSVSPRFVKVEDALETLVSPHAGKSSGEAEAAAAGE